LLLLLDVDGCLALPEPSLRVVLGDGAEALEDALPAVLLVNDPLDTFEADSFRSGSHI
jgi:hypothetical protein